MGVIADIVGEAVNGLISSAGKTAIDVRTAVDGISPDKKAEITELTDNLAAQAQKAQTDLLAAQAQIDAAEAGVTGSNFFKFWVAGWRPFVGWVCGAAFLLQCFVQPVANWAGLHLAVIDMNDTMKILTGLLGLGNIAARTVEKIQSASSNH